MSIYICPFIHLLYKISGFLFTFLPDNIICFFLVGHADLGGLQFEGADLSQHSVFQAVEGIGLHHLYHLVSALFFANAAFVLVHFDDGLAS